MREDAIQPNRIEMFKLMHTRKNGILVDEASREIMVNIIILLKISWRITYPYNKIKSR